MSGLYQSPQNSSASNNAANQQYCLKWNNHTNNMVKVFNELLEDENFVDVTLACDGVSIKAHKMVLSACSTYFRDLFINNPCKHPIVILKDIQYEDLRAIIHFMYSGEVNVSYTQLAPLLKTAEALKVKGLTDVNEKHGNAFFNGNHSETYSNGNDLSDSPTNPTAAAVAANLQLYNRIALESNIAEQNPYLAFMTQRLKKRRRKQRNGSALALANMLNSNGNFLPGANGFGKNSSASLNTKQTNNTISTNGLDNSNHSNGSSNHQLIIADDEEDNNESGDEVNSTKRIKDSNSSSDSINNANIGDNPQQSPYSTSSGLNNTHCGDDDEEEDEDAQMMNDTNGDNDNVSSILYSF